VCARLPRQRHGRPHHVQLSCSGSHGAVAAIRAGWGLGCLNESAIPGDLVRPRGWTSPGKLSFYLQARPGLEAAAAALKRWAGSTLAG
jgi:DNA-binding transcriptional LysR family regulator